MLKMHLMMTHGAYDKHLTDEEVVFFLGILNRPLLWSWEIQRWKKSIEKEAEQRGISLVPPRPETPPRNPVTRPARNDGETSKVNADSGEQERKKKKMNSGN